MQHPPMQIASPSRVRSARPGSPPRDFSRVDSNEQRKEKVISPSLSRAGIREYGESRESVVQKKCPPLSIHKENFGAFTRNSYHDTQNRVDKPQTSSSQPPNITPAALEPSYCHHITARGHSGVCAETVRLDDDGDAVPDATRSLSLRGYFE